MRRLIRLAVSLYPPAWRKRYGAEFDDLLEDAGSRWSDLWDVLKGAFAMQLTTWSFTRIAALCGVAGLAAAAAIAIATPDRYISTAVLTFGEPFHNGESMLGLQRSETDVLSPSNLTRIVTTFNLYPEERRKMPMEEVVSEMRNRAIQITPVVIGQPGRVFALRFVYRDRAKAAAVTRELTSLLIASAKSPHADAPLISLEVLDPASLPQTPFAPNRAAIILAGLALGLLAATLIVGVRRWPLVAASGLAAALLAGAISFALPARWVSIAVMRVSPPEAAAQVVAALQATADPNVQVTAIRAARRAPSGAFQIRATSRDRFQAQAIARQTVTQMTERAPKIAALSSMEVLDPASLPQRPSSPNRLSFVLLGLIGGLLLGGIWQRLRRERRPVSGIA